ncbi:MAG: hypothetical protein Q8L41_05005 [Anaerolineales bacterium]|nr:hypothetical protein [Anaerolineales bacterium]
MLLWDYFKETESFIKRIFFFYEGIRYEGSGVMQWNPAKGFHIAAQVKPENEIPFSKNIGSVDLRPSRRIYMQLGSNSLAIIPEVRLNELDLLINHHVVLNVGRVIFIQRRDDKHERKSWSGAGLYELADKPIFPDTIATETKIGDSKPLESFSRAGLYHDDPSGEQIIGRFIENKYFEANWSFPKEIWSKNYGWQIANGIKEAISILDGQEIKMRVREVYYENKYVYEVNALGKTSSLDSISRLFDNDVLKRNEIVNLAKFFVKGGEKAGICRNIFQQIIESSHQKSWQANELLLATILEAALRNLYNHPFKSGANKQENKIDINKHLKRFREEYLSKDVEVGRKWKNTIYEVVKAQKQLRDKNAHPDWMFSQGGEYSKDETTKALDNMVILSRFYGTMIKALAGFENLTPVSYKPVTDWKIMSIERGVKKPEQN